MKVEPLFNDDLDRNTQFESLYKQLVSRESAIVLMMKVLAESKEAGIRFFLLPAKYTWEYSPSLSSNRNDQDNKILLERYYSDIQKRTPGADVVNLSKIFNHLSVERAPYTSPQITHYNDLGNSVLANIIYSNIKDDIVDIYNKKNTTFVKTKW